MAQEDVPDDALAVVNPAFLVEVTSPSTEEYDRGEKLRHYKQLAVDGMVLVYTASVSFEEILDTRVTSEELREEVE